jgi:hypothetical protein
MTTKAPLLGEQRKFPYDDVKSLARICDQSYIDIANKINSRTIGIFPSNTNILTGERWFLEGQPKPQSTIRQVFRFSDSALTIAHGIDLASLTNFTRIYGCFFDGTNWQALPYVSVVAATSQIGVLINSTNIVVTKGVGAPAISSGLIVLEWLSKT